MAELAPATKRVDGFVVTTGSALRFVAAMLVVVTHSTLYASERLCRRWP